MILDVNQGNFVSCMCLIWDQLAAVIGGLIWDFFVNDFQNISKYKMRGNTFPKIWFWFIVGLLWGPRGPWWFSTAVKSKLPLELMNRLLTKFKAAGSQPGTAAMWVLKGDVVVAFWRWHCVFIEKQHYFNSLYWRTCRKHQVKALVQSAMEEPYRNNKQKCNDFGRMYKMSVLLNKTCRDLPSNVHYSWICPHFTYSCWHLHIKSPS